MVRDIFLKEDFEDEVDDEVEASDRFFVAGWLAVLFWLIGR